MLYMYLKIFMYYTLIYNIKKILLLIIINVFSVLETVCAKFFDVQVSISKLKQDGFFC